MADFAGDRETLRALVDDGNEKALDRLADPAEVLDRLLDSSAVGGA
jgi:hypothetical protein